ncbi:hypothetical protein EK599_05290 [Vibrio sp. T187]|uniref:hypothetical protein n=1 Tax=Vibrio TaxID=662 RepID=UPI0010C97A1A|nr:MULTISPECIES: hypothetical protein [Vibrio]MBW3695095.1 hypothetical protein [Vibrio sp. T187]
MSKVILSEEASFPSPAIQLQQLLAHGLIEAQKAQVPLIRGDLADFSQSNIQQQFDAPVELEHLQQRLKKLKSLNQ